MALETQKQLLYLQMDKGRLVDQKVYGRQGDRNLQTLEVHIVDINGNPVNLTTATKVMFNARSFPSPDGSVFVTDGEAEIVDAIGGVVDYTFSKTNFTGPSGRYETAYFDIEFYIPETDLNNRFGASQVQSTEDFELNMLKVADIQEEENGWYLARIESLMNEISNRGIETIPTLDQVITASVHDDDPDTGYYTAPLRIRVGSQDDSATMEREAFTVLERYDVDRLTQITASGLLLESTGDPNDPDNDGSYFRLALNSSTGAGEVYMSDDFRAYFAGIIDPATLLNLIEDSDTVRMVFNTETQKIHFDAVGSEIVNADNLLKRLHDSDTVHFYKQSGPEETEKVYADVHVTFANVEGNPYGNLALGQALSNKEDKLTAGANIRIENIGGEHVIWASGELIGANWGTIGPGDDGVVGQADLVQYIAEQIDAIALIGGDGIIIEDGIIYVDEEVIATREWVINNIAQMVVNKADKFYSAADNYVRIKDLSAGQTLEAHTILQLNDNKILNLPEGQGGRIVFDGGQGSIGPEVSIEFGNGTWKDGQLTGSYVALVDTDSDYIIKKLMNGGVWLDTSYEFIYALTYDRTELDGATPAVPQLIADAKMGESIEYNLVDVFNSEVAHYEENYEAIETLDAKVDSNKEEFDVFKNETDDMLVILADEAELAITTADEANGTAQAADAKADDAIATADAADAKADAAIATADEAHDTADEALEASDYVKERVGEVGVDTVIEGADVVVDLVDFHDLNDQLISRAYADEHFTDPLPPKINNSTLEFGGNKTGAQLGLVDQQVSAGSSTSSILNYGDEVILGYTNPDSSSQIILDDNGVVIASNNDDEGISIRTMDHTFVVDGSGAKLDGTFANMNNYPVIAGQINPKNLGLNFKMVGDSVSFTISTNQVFPGGAGPTAGSVVTAIRTATSTLHFSAVDTNGLAWHASANTANDTSIENWVHGEVAETFNQVLAASDDAGETKNTLLIQDDGSDGSANDTYYTNSGILINELNPGGQLNYMQTFSDGYLNMYNPNNGNLLLVDTYTGQFDARGPLGDSLYNWIQTYVPSPTPPGPVPNPDDYIYFHLDAFDNIDFSMFKFTTGDDFYYDSRGRRFGGSLTELTLMNPQNIVINQEYVIGTLKDGITPPGKQNSWIFNFHDPHDFLTEVTLVLRFFMHKSGILSVACTKQAGQYSESTTPISVQHAPTLEYKNLAGGTGVWNGNEIFELLNTSHIVMANNELIWDDNARTFGGNANFQFKNNVEEGATYHLGTIDTRIANPLYPQIWHYYFYDPEGTELLNSVRFTMQTDGDFIAYIAKWGYNGTPWEHEISLDIKGVDRQN
jgi:hypothetical protein